MMEGSLLFFGLLAILLAIIISRKRSQSQAGHIGWWIGLILASALCLASKHSGAVFVGGAFGWILLTALVRAQRRDLPVVLVQLASSTALVLLLFFALSPALWFEPMDRVNDLLQARTALIDIQVQADPAAPTALGERIAGIVRQPFMEAVWHFEAGGWTSFVPIQDEIDRYMASPLSGLQFGAILGGLLTVLSLVGLIDLLRQGWTYRSGLLVWLALTLVMLLVNPLPWQRYSLPLIPISTLLAGLGALAIVRLAQRQAQAQSSPDATFLYNEDEIRS
jgi:4-amino-4-deoxy-L-arabinose transferase-like glycosyltransferase